MLFYKEIAGDLWLVWFISLVSKIFEVCNAIKSNNISMPIHLLWILWWFMLCDVIPNEVIPSYVMWWHVIRWLWCDHMWSFGYWLYKYFIFNIDHISSLNHQVVSWDQCLCLKVIILQIHVITKTITITNTDHQLFFGITHHCNRLRINGMHLQYIWRMCCYHIKCERYSCRDFIYKESVGSLYWAKTFWQIFCTNREFFDKSFFVK